MSTDSNTAMPIEGTIGPNVDSFAKKDLPSVGMQHTARADFTARADADAAALSFVKARLHVNSCRRTNVCGYMRTHQAKHGSSAGPYSRAKAISQNAISRCRRCCLVMFCSLFHFSLFPLKCFHAAYRIL